MDITYDWRIRAEKPLLQTLSPLLRPLFEANHRWAMAQGEASLTLELARRRATSDAARAAVPPPPGPVTYAAVALIGGAAVVGGTLTLSSDARRASITMASRWTRFRPDRAPRSCQTTHSRATARIVHGSVALRAAPAELSFEPASLDFGERAKLGRRRANPAPQGRVEIFLAAVADVPRDRFDLRRRPEERDGARDPKQMEILGRRACRTARETPDGDGPGVCRRRAPEPASSTA